MVQMVYKCTVLCDCETGRSVINCYHIIVKVMVTTVLWESYHLYVEPYCGYNCCCGQSVHDYQFVWMLPWLPICKLPWLPKFMWNLPWLQVCESNHGYQFVNITMVIWAASSYHCLYGQVTMITSLCELPWLHVCVSYQLPLLMWTRYHGYHS